MGCSVGLVFDKASVVVECDGRHSACGENLAVVTLGGRYPVRVACTDGEH
jgi:ribosomal protein S27E